MNILVAEDEEDLKDVIEAVLDANGYTVDVTENGAQMLEKANSKEYAAIVSDIMMPVMDGITAVKKLRESGNDTPVLFLTAKTEVDDRINGLDAGADDYLTKPFAVGELLARVRAMTRRSRANTQKVISVYNITLDTEKEELTGQNSIRLPAKESHMLGYFMNNPEKDFSSEELIEKFWKNEDNADEEAVWLYVSFLKNKLRAVGAAATIEGEKGRSYRLAGTE